MMMLKAHIILCVMDNFLLRGHTGRIQDDESYVCASNYG